VLGPVPGERNEPANAAGVIDAIAELKELDKQEILEAVFHNTCQLYGKLV
jgi:Tat protein secretion system quality control protein TatD with DNase activity